MQHIKELSRRLSQALQPSGDKQQMGDLAKALALEMQLLDTRDFPPASRASLAIAKAAAERLSSIVSVSNPNHIITLTENICLLMDAYGHVPTGRKFCWIRSQDMRAIVERDYAELSLKLIPDGAWKSSVVLAGSITEAILFDLIVEDPARLVLARKTASAPRKSGHVRPEDEWTLANLIDIAVELKIIPADRAKTFDQVLRDYRNFVHPKKEVRSRHPCGEGEAYMSKGALDALCDHFDRTFP